MPKIWRKPDPHEDLILTRAAPPEPSRFSGSRTVGGFVVLDWETGDGTVGWAHPVHAAHASAVSLTRAAREQAGDSAHEGCAALVTPLLLRNPDQSPELRAVDLYPDGAVSGEYEPAWHELAAVLGTPVPWFHYALRDAGTVAGGKPGAPRAFVPARDPSAGPL